MTDSDDYNTRSPLYKRYEEKKAGDPNPNPQAAETLDIPELSKGSRRRSTEPEKPVPKKQGDETETPLDDPAYQQGRLKQSDGSGQPDTANKAVNSAVDRDGPTKSPIYTMREIDPDAKPIPHEGEIEQGGNGPTVPQREGEQAKTVSTAEPEIKKDNEAFFAGYIYIKDTQTLGYKAKSPDKIFSTNAGELVGAERGADGNPLRHYEVDSEGKIYAAEMHGQEDDVYYKKSKDAEPLGYLLHMDKPIPVLESALPHRVWQDKQDEYEQKLDSKLFVGTPPTYREYQMKNWDTSAPKIPSVKEKAPVQVAVAKARKQLPPDVSPDEEFPTLDQRRRRYKEATEAMGPANGPVQVIYGNPSPATDKKPAPPRNWTNTVLTGAAGLAVAAAVFTAAANHRKKQLDPADSAPDIIGTRVNAESSYVYPDRLRTMFQDAAARGEDILKDYKTFMEASGKPIELTQTDIFSDGTPQRNVKQIVTSENFQMLAKYTLNNIREVSLKHPDGTGMLDGTPRYIPELAFKQECLGRNDPPAISRN